MATDVRSPGKWVGGKFLSAEKIINTFPAPHLYDRYIEPCGGMAHVFFARPRHGEEIYNDLNDLLYNLKNGSRDSLARAFAVGLTP